MSRPLAFASWAASLATVATLFGCRPASTACDPTPTEASLSPAATPVKALVDSCNDGDTCRIRLTDNLRLKVRLAGIDAPEAGRQGTQPLGREAADRLNALVQGREVHLVSHDLDPYNRPIVEISIDSLAVNMQLVEEGLAEVYRKAPKSLDLAPYTAAEARARAAKRGIWSLARYEPPATYRKAQKSH